MQKKLFIFTLIMFFLMTFSSMAEQHDDYLGCGILERTKNLMKQSTLTQKKLMESARQSLEKSAQDYTMAKELGITPRTLNITIPVVVHIVHGNGTENMSDAEIQYVMDWTNSDYSAGRVGGSCDGFGYLQANVGFNFQLAKKDPYGNPTTGIERHYEPTWTTNATAYEYEIKSTYQWPPHKYLNVYVVRSSDGGSGSAFAYYPHSVTGANSVYDGIIISAWAMGRTAGYESIFAHEIGHWANLIHTWGQNYANGDPNACNDDDQVSDTPNTSGFTGTTCVTQYTCGSWDNIENLMDYGTQPPTMFTFGQSARMEAAMQSSTAGRNNLWTAQNLIDTGIDTTPPPPNEPPIAVVNGPYSGVPNTAISFSSAGSYDPDGTIVSYAWDFGDGTTSTTANPTHTYSSSGTFTVTLTVTDDQGATGTASTTANIDGTTGTPVANVNGPYSGTVNSPINFSSAGSYDPDGTIVSYAWDFGDGATSTTANPTHTYTVVGTFTVSLTVTDNQGNTGTATTTATITDTSTGITTETEPNDSSAEANGPMGFGTSVSASFGTTNDQDWFYFDVTSPRNLNISATLTGGTEGNWLLYHESNLANYVAYPTSGLNGSYNATQTGRYYLLMYTWAGGNTTYNIVVQ